MAIGQTLRYYRQQFNPETAYQSQSARGDVFSMYDPEGMNRYIEAVSKRQERFDAAKMSEASEIARLGETETYDLAELTNRIKSFESGVSNMVKDKYNGDYSAAANSIAKMIGTERTNPFYHFNKEKVTMGRAYLDTQMKMGANFMSARSPFNVSFKDWQNGETFDFVPVNREDIVRSSAAEFGSLANTMMNTPELRDTPDGRFIISTIQYGLKDPEQLNQFMLSKPGQDMINNIISRNPELAKLPREQLMGAITEGAYSAIGRAQVGVNDNPDYIDAYKAAQLEAKSKGPGNLVVSAGILNNPQLANEIKEEQSNLSNAYKESIIKDVLKNPKYAPLRSSVSSYKDIDKGVLGEIWGSTSKLYAGPKTMELLNKNKSERPPISPLLGDLVKELDRKTDEYFSGQTKEKGVPVGMSSYKLTLLPEDMSSENITLVNKIQDQFETVLKPYIIGKKLPSNTSFIGRGSRKHAESMDATKQMTVTNIGLSPFSNHIIFGVTGIDKSGNATESKVSINAGDNGIMDDNIQEILGAYGRLGRDNSHFMDELYTWTNRYYPDYFK